MRGKEYIIRRLDAFALGRELHASQTKDTRYAEKLKHDAEVLFDAIKLIRELSEVRWEELFTGEIGHRKKVIAIYKGRYLKVVTGFGLSRNFKWAVWSETEYQSGWESSLVLAQRSAIAWVDEGCNAPTNDSIGSEVAAVKA